MTLPTLNRGADACLTPPPSPHSSPAHPGTMSAEVETPIDSTASAAAPSSTPPTSPVASKVPFKREKKKGEPGKKQRFCLFFSDVPVLN